MDSYIAWRMERVGRIVVSAGLAVFLLLGFTPRPAKKQAPVELTQNPLARSQVFGSKGCVKCHAINGLGGTIGPDLGAISRRRSFYELAATMWNHLPQMGALMEELGVQRPQMDAQEAGDLIAFLFTLDYFDPPGDVDVGKKLYSDKKCVVCHQVGVYGGVIGPSLDNLSQFGSPIIVAASMWNHGPAMAEAMAKRGITRPTFSGTELTDLIAYLESVGPEPLQGPLYVLPGNAERGRVIFTEKRCIECHSVSGVGGRIGPDLAKQEIQVSMTEFAAAMWNKEPAMASAMEARGIPIPQLGAGEMADLVAYLYSVRYFAETGDADAGRRHLTAKRCLTCHSLAGSGGKTAGDLAQVSGLDSPAAVVSALWNHSVLMETESETQSIAWPEVSPAQMADVMAFFQTLVTGTR